MLLHALSVNALTASMQVRLNTAVHYQAMNRQPDTPADRVRWAIDQSGKSLEAIAAAAGCTHAALSQWQTGKTNLHNVKVGLLIDFCKTTGANIQWLLTGDGPKITHYSSGSNAEAPLLAAARHIVMERSPALADTALRLLSALDAEPGA